MWCLFFCATLHGTKNDRAAIFAKFQINREFVQE